MENIRVSSSSSSPELVTETWAYTKLKVIKYSFKWTIDNFSCSREENKEALLSPPFSDGSIDNPKLLLKLYPKGKTEENKEYLSLYLAKAHPYSSTEVRAKFIFAILNASNEETNVRKHTDIRKFKGDSYWGYGQFIKRDILFGKAEELLADDKLTVCCGVTVFTDPVNISGQHSSIQIPECNYSTEFGMLLESQQLTDVILISADGRQLAAHKAILAALSPVFSDMFKHEMKECISGRVDITDMDYEVLQDMLNYIYTGKVYNMKNNPKDLLVAADKYAIDRLKIMCEDFLCKNISCKNAADVLVLADLHNAKLLKAGAIDFINLHATDVTDTTTWREMFQNHPALAAEVFRYLASQCSSLIGPPQKKQKL